MKWRDLKVNREGEGVAIDHPLLRMRMRQDQARDLARRLLAACDPAPAPVAPPADDDGDFAWRMGL